MCHVFIHHTSASLIITENADSDVQVDLDSYMARLVKDGDPSSSIPRRDPMTCLRMCVGVDGHTLTVPVRDGRCDLGTWQGIFLWEHRALPHRRCVTVSFIGQGKAMIRRYVFRFEQAHRGKEAIADIVSETHRVLQSVPGVEMYELGTPAVRKRWQPGTFRLQRRPEQFLSHTSNIHVTVSMLTSSSNRSSKSSKHGTSCPRVQLPAGV